MRSISAVGYNEAKSIALSPGASGNCDRASFFLIHIRVASALTERNFSLICGAGSGPRYYRKTCRVGRVLPSKRVRRGPFACRIAGGFARPWRR